MSSSFESTFNTRVMPQIERYFGVGVKLIREHYISDEFTARRDEIVQSSFGFIAVEAKVTKRDWLLPIADCVLQGMTTKPQPKDRIIELDDDGNTVATWEVFSPDQGVPAVEEETGGNDWRVHSRKINA